MSIVSFSALKNSIFNLISKFVLLVRVYFHVKMIFYFLTNGLIIEVFTHVDKQSLFFVPSCGRAKSLQSCLTLCDPLDCSPPGSSVHGIIQVRILEWVAMSSSRESSQPRDQTCVFCIGREILYLLSHQGNPRLLLTLSLLSSTYELRNGAHICFIACSGLKAMCGQKGREPDVTVFFN